MTPEEFEKKVKTGEVHDRLGLDKSADASLNKSETKGDSVDQVIAAMEKANGGANNPKWLIEGVNKIESGKGIPSSITKRLEAYLLKNNISQKEIDIMKPDQAWRTAGKISGIIKPEQWIEETDVSMSDKDKKGVDESWKNKFKGKEKPATKNKTEKLSREDMDFLRHQVNFWDSGNRFQKIEEFTDILEKFGIPKEKIIKTSIEELIEETRKITGQEAMGHSQKVMLTEKDPQKIDSKKEYDTARMEYVRRLTAQDYDADQIKRMINSPEGKKIIKDIFEFRKKETGETEESLEQIKPKQELGNEVSDKRDEEIVGDKDYAESLRKDMEKEIDKIHKKISDVYEKEKANSKSKFEEYEEKLSEVTGGKFDYEIYKRSYLNTLGCEIKYNIWRTKAWVIEKKTGNFIGKNGEIIEKNDKKTERAEFDTAWRFPVETPLIKFLRAQVEKKLTGVQISIEQKPTPEESRKKWREQFGPLAEAQDEIDKYNKEKWREQFGSLAEVQEEIERYKENKPKSFWQRVRVFFSRDKKF